MVFFNCLFSRFLSLIFKVTQNMRILSIFSTYTYSVKPDEKKSISRDKLKIVIIEFWFLILVMIVLF